MIIKTLNINNLRNLKSIDVELHPRLNVLLGDNGAGKTSVLESIVVLAKGRSFRAGQIGALIGPEEPFLRVVARTMQKNKRQQVLGLERSRDEWKARKDGENVRYLSDLAPHLPLVLLEPNSHLLVSGPPDGRRRFIDWGVFHVEHAFLGDWRRYSRALKQRNAALRARSVPVLDSLDAVLADMGERVTRAREAQIARLAPCLEETINRLNPGLGDVRVKFDRGWKGDSLSKALADHRAQDLERLTTGPGPHRSDLRIYQGRLLARDRLSRGEQKILSAALLMSQARLMSESGETPLILLDDLSSEFDHGHLSGVMSETRQLGAQVWITGTSRSPYEESLGSSHSMFHVEHGKISSETRV